MPLEVEMKLTIPAEVTAEMLFSDPMVTEAIRTMPVTTHMLSRYYDTENGDLMARRWTLRLRKEGDTSVLCCKTASAAVAAGLFSRGEWQVYSDDLRTGVRRLVDEGAPEEMAELADRLILSGISAL